MDVWRLIVIRNENFPEQMKLLESHEAVKCPLKTIPSPLLGLKALKLFCSGREIPRCSLDNTWLS